MTIERGRGVRHRRRCRTGSLDLSGKLVSSWSHLLLRMLHRSWKALMIWDRRTGIGGPGPGPLLTYCTGQFGYCPYVDGNTHERVLAPNFTALVVKRTATSE